MSSKPSKNAQRRLAAAAAAKGRRQKVIAFGGLGLLGVLLFIQGPRMLDLLSTPEVTTLAARPVVPGAARSEPKPAKPAALPSTGADPFAVRALPNTDPGAGSVPAPEGASDPFVQIASAAQEPAAQPTAAPALPKQIIIGTPEPNKTARRGWIVVIASIPVGSGRRGAERFARNVARDGLASVDVLESSTRRSLRAGYYVVYNGPYATLRAVQRAAGRVHALGYRTAYVRRILQY